MAHTASPASAPAIGSLRRASGRAQETTIQYGLSVLTIFLVLAPIIPIVYQSFIDRALYDAGHQLTLQNYARLVQSDGFWKIVGNTVALALGSTLIAVFAGVVAAILVGRTDMPGRGLMGELFLWPLYVSSLVLSFAWATVYGPSGYVVQWVEQTFGFIPWNIFSLGGMAVVAGVSMAPIVFVYTLSSARLTEASFEDAARIAGAGRFATLFHVTLPLMKPAIFFSALLTFTGALEVLSIPLVFGEPSGVRTLSTFLYKHATSGGGLPDYGLVATAALILIAVVFGLLVLQNRWVGSTRKYETVGGKAGRPRLFRLGARVRWAVSVAAALYIVLVVLFPLGLLLLRACVSLLHPMVPLEEVLTLDNFRALLEFPTYARSIVNSFLVAGIGAAFATGLVLMIAIVVHRSEFRWRGPLLYAALVPRAVPGLIAGIGFFYAVAMFPPFAGLRSTIWILIIAFTMANIPLGYGAIGPMLVKLSPELDRAARVQGASWWTTVTRIVMPLAKPALIACYTILFIAFFKEYSTAVFLYTVGSEVIGTTLLQFWVQGQIGHVAALSVVQIATIALCLGAARFFFGVRMYG
jgi:iron(III) transport system permease protein